MVKMKTLPKKMGRPFSENPKSMRVDVRLTKEEMEKLDKYCAKMNVTRPQGLRNGIKELEKR